MVNFVHQGKGPIRSPSERKDPLNEDALASLQSAIDQNSPNPSPLSNKAVKVESSIDFMKKITDVVTEAKNAVVDKVFGVAINVGARYLLKIEEDEAIIKAALPEAEGNRLVALVNREAPRLSTLVRKMSPSLDRFFAEHVENGEEFFKRCLLHLIAKFAARNKGNTAEEFIETCFLQLVATLGPEWNRIDEAIVNGTPISKDLFIPLASLLFDALFPQDGFIYKFKATATEKMAEAFSERYQPIADWLGGADFPKGEKEPLPYQKELDHFGPLILEKIADYYIDKDRKYLQKLTKKDDFNVMIEHWAPSLCAQVLKNFDLPLDRIGLRGRQDLLEKVTRALVLRASSNLARELFKNGFTVTPEDFMQEVVNYFSKNLHHVCKNAESHKNVQVDHFYDASCNLAKTFLPKYKWFNQFIERRQERFLKPVAELHHSFYETSYNESTIEGYKDRLTQMLLDPDQPDKDVALLVDQLYSLCHNFAAMAKDKGSVYFAKDTHVLKFVKNLQKNSKNPLDDHVLQTLENGIQQILSAQDGEISWVSEKIVHRGTTRLFHALICWLEKVPEGERNPPEKLFYKAFELLLKVGEAQFDDLTHSGEDNPFTEESLAPATEKFFQLFSEVDQIKTDDELTLPEKLEKKAMESIQKECQSIFAKILVTITSWTKERKKSEDKLEALFQSKNMLRLGNLGQHMVIQGIPYFLKNKGEELTDKYLMPKLASFLAKEGSTLSDLKEYDAIKETIQGFLRVCGEKISEEDTSPEQKLIHFLGVFVETASIRLIGDLFTRIEAGDSLLEDILLLGIEEGTEHFKAIGETKKKTKKNRPLRDDLIQEFEKRDLLHPALKGEEEREQFFSKLSEQVLHIFGIDEKSELPIPDWLKGISFEVQEKMFPEILDSICKTLCDSTTINQVLLSILNHVIEEGKLDPSLIEKLFPDEATHKMAIEGLDPKFTDQYQDELQKKLSAAIEALIKMHPDRIPKLLMRSNYLKKAAAQAIGQPLREQIRDPESDAPISLLTLVDKIVSAYLNEIAPGEYNAEESFVYYKTSLEGKVKKDEANKPIEAGAPNLSRFFPKTAKEKIRADKFEAKQKREAARNVPQLIRKIINRETDQIAVKAFAKFWANAERKINDKFLDWFGDRYGKAIFRLVLPVLRLIRFPFQLIVLVFNYTVWIVVSQILKLIFNNQAKKRAADVSVDIHDNIVLRMTDQIIDRYDQALA